MKFASMVTTPRCVILDEILLEQLLSYRPRIRTRYQWEWWSSPFSLLTCANYKHGRVILDGIGEYGHHLTVFGSVLPLIDDQHSLFKSAGISIQPEICSTGVLFLMELASMVITSRCSLLPTGGDWELEKSSTHYPPICHSPLPFPHPTLIGRRSIDRKIVTPSALLSAPAPRR